MATDSGSADPDEDDNPLRPAWEDAPDETDADRGLPRPRAGATRALHENGEARDFQTLLVPLCTAVDALARLDARAAAADGAVREGLIARLAYAEAAGFLSHVHAWAHPLDLALRDAGLTASTALAATGAGYRTLPQTFGELTTPGDWTDPPFEALADGDRSLAEALALARAIRRLVRRTGATTAADATDVLDALPALGGGMPDRADFSAWWRSVVPLPGPRRHQFGHRAGEGAAPPPLPALLVAAQAAKGWMEAPVTDGPTPTQALFLAAAVLSRIGPTRSVLVSFWAAYPALGTGDRAALPTLRSDAADRLAGRDRPITWPITYFHLVAESARVGLRELDRLALAAVKGRGLAAAADKRSRLPHAIDVLLRTPVLTPKALAGKLRVAPQTATALFRELQTRGVVREITGRGSFRAFAI